MSISRSIKKSNTRLKCCERKEVRVARAVSALCLSLLKPRLVYRAFPAVDLLEGFSAGTPVLLPLFNQRS